MTRNDKALRRRFRSLDLGVEERIFLRLLSSLGLAAWALIIYAELFAPPSVQAPPEKPIEVAKLLLKPPAPPEEKKEEPKPVPLPPRADTEKPKPAPVKKAPPKAAVVAKAQPKPEPPRRSVATMGQIGRAHV